MNKDVRPGDIWVAALSSPRVAAGREPKNRPVVVVRLLSGRRALIAGLTTLPRFGDEQPRIPAPQDMGNGRQTYLWGGNLVAIPLASLSLFVDRANDKLIDVLATQHGLSPREADAMRSVPAWAAPLQELVR